MSPNITLNSEVAAAFELVEDNVISNPFFIVGYGWIDLNTISMDTAQKLTKDGFLPQLKPIEAKAAVAKK